MYPYVGEKLKYTGNYFFREIASEMCDVTWLHKVDGLY